MFREFEFLLATKTPGSSRMGGKLIGTPPMSRFPSSHSGMVPFLELACGFQPKTESTSRRNFFLKISGHFQLVSSICLKKDATIYSFRILRDAGRLQVFLSTRGFHSTGRSIGTGSTALLFLGVRRYFSGQSGSHGRDRTPGRRGRRRRGEGHGEAHGLAVWSWAPGVRVIARFLGFGPCWRQSTLVTFGVLGHTGGSFVLG